MVPSWYYFSQDYLNGPLSNFCNYHHVMNRGFINNLEKSEVEKSTLLTALIVIGIMSVQKKYN